MRRTPGSFATRLKAFREAAGFTQEELATIAGLSVHAVSALERGERRRPQPETVRALASALDLTAADRDALVASARRGSNAADRERPERVPLPLPLTALVGRDADLQTLRPWLVDPVLRLITLVGPGGVGKTRLALELARGVAKKGSTRVVFVPLAAVTKPSLVACVIAEAFGLADGRTVNLPKYARVACDGQPTLLVLDNFEQLLDATPLVAELLSSVPLLRLLVTSRAPLHLRGEREYTVGPLDVASDADAISAADLARASAVTLFVERVRDVQPDFQITAANAPTIAAICRRLDALPLALELAAPWMKALSAEDLLRRLDYDVLLSNGSSRAALERQQTMNAAVAWSYQLLDPDEQCAFRRFGVLPGPFSIEAAAAVSGDAGAAGGPDDALRAATALIDKSLLFHAGTTLASRPMYQMLGTVRAYAAIELAAADERDDAMEGLVRYCTSEASLAVEGLVGTAQADWLKRVHDDLETHRAALIWLIDQCRTADAVEIVCGLLHFWLIRGRTAEGLGWCDQILKLPSLPPVEETRLLLASALMWFTQGELERARDAIARALALARGAGDMQMVVRVEDAYGRIDHGLGNLIAARQWFTHSLEGFTALGVRRGIGNALIGMAAVVLAAGDVDEAERLLDEATPHLDEAGGWFLSRALFLRSMVAVRRRNGDDAIALVRESLTRIRDLQDKFALVYALVSLAAAAVLTGDDAWAARILGARDAISERTGAVVVLGSVQELREQTERSARARLGNDRWTQAYGKGRLASIDALLEDIDHAVSSRARV